MNLKILQHENIPQPLHGTAPRVVKKSPRGWWINERKAALKLADNHCMACGVHVAAVPFFKGRLEVHEQYNIDHLRGRMTYVGSVAICNACHSFIHCGRMYNLLKKGDVSAYRFEQTMKRGLNLLKENGLKPAWTQAYIWLEYNGWTEARIHPHLIRQGVTVPPHTAIAWDDWRLIIPNEGGEEVYSPVNNESDWTKKYGGIA